MHVSQLQGVLAPNALNSKRSNTPWSGVLVSYLRRKIQVVFKRCRLATVHCVPCDFPILSISLHCLDLRVTLLAFFTVE
jgi:hypothetical protein